MINPFKNPVSGPAKGSGPSRFQGPRVPSRGFNSKSSPRSGPGFGFNSGPRSSPKYGPRSDPGARGEYGDLQYLVQGEQRLVPGGRVAVSSP